MVSNTMNMSLDNSIKLNVCEYMKYNIQKANEEKYSHAFKRMSHPYAIFVQILLLFFHCARANVHQLNVIDMKVKILTVHLSSGMKYTAFNF